MLVIIGLIVGGVLVGQDLIAAAEVRAQITQIEKYNSAVNTFRGKFNALPGDMRPEIAAQYGFTVGTNCNGQLLGRRDGNGLIDGNLSAATQLQQYTGETGLFWQDLSSSISGNLIDGTFPNSGGTYVTCGVAIIMQTTALSQYYPPAKISHGNFVYVYENSGYNWFGVSAVTSVNSGAAIVSNANISVIQSYSLDVKIDDGLPLSGNTQAVYINYNNSAPVNAPNTATSGGTSSSCYDTTTGTYSITVNNGNSGNCALSFKFQ